MKHSLQKTNVARCGEFMQTLQTVLNIYIRRLLFYTYVSFYNYQHTRNGNASTVHGTHIFELGTGMETTRLY